MKSNLTLLHSALGVVLTGGLTLCLAVIMVIAAPVPEFGPSPLNPGFATSQAILWFELVHDGPELAAVLTPARPGDDLRSALDAINLYDFPFMAGYSLFFAAMLVFLRSRSLAHRETSFFGSSFYLAAGMLFVPLMLVGDIMENTQLLKLTRYGDSATVPWEVILNLEVFTRMKWGAIFLASAHLGLSYLALTDWSPRQRGWFWLLGVAFLSATIPGLVALAVLEARALLQLTTIGTLIAWPGTLAHAALCLRRSPRASGES